MLKFLTHKLKNHSLNDNSPHHKVEDDDHDSGTESDDEHGTCEEPEISMESEGGSVVTALSRSRSSLLTAASSPYFLDSALPSDCDQGYDQHSSEEELEVINCKQAKHTTGQEKRKWSQVTPESVRRRTIGCRGSSSSDDEGPGDDRVHDAVSSGAVSEPGLTGPLCVPVITGGGQPSGPRLLPTPSLTSAPLQFRASPPRGAHRPSSAPHHEPSPRKRHRNAAPPRPSLDFEKMQQLQARAVTSWRHGGESTGELSVYCW